MRVFVYGTLTDPDRVAVYVGDPEALSVGEDDWPGDGSFAERVERYVRAVSVYVCAET